MAKRQTRPRPRTAPLRSRPCEHRRPRDRGRGIAGPDRRRGRARSRTASCSSRSQRVAALLHQAGLRRGDGVALVLPNRPEFFEITWGCQLSGLYYSAVNTHFTPDEVAYVIGDSEARAVFIDQSMAELGEHILEVNKGVDVHVSVGGALPGWRSYSDALAGSGDAPPVSDGSEMLYSSGTTGRPKAVRRPLPEDGQGSWAQKVLEYSLAQRYDMTPSSVYLSPAPLYHAAGINYTMAVHRVGAASILMRKFDAEAVLRLIETHRVTHAQFVPTMFVRMLKLPEAVRAEVRRLEPAVRHPCRRAVPGRRQASDDGVVRPDHPRVLRRHRGIRGHDHRPRGVARTSRIGRQAVQPRARRRRGRNRARGRRVRGALLRGRTGVRVLQGPREDGIGVQ